VNNLRTSPPKFLQKPSPYFFMVHLLHRLYGVDAPAFRRRSTRTSTTELARHLSLHTARTRRSTRNAVFIHAASCKSRFVGCTYRRSLSAFFRDIMDPASCLHSLLPPPRSAAVTSRLRSSQILPKVYTRTKRYCSFIQYGLNHYQ